MMFFFESPITIIITLVSLAIALAAQAGVRNAYKKYSKVSVSNNMTGADVARRMVQGTGVDVVLHNGGELSDHFDPRKKIIGLSPDVYNGNSVAAFGIAAHEAGHALQHDKGYVPIKLRNGILPVVKIGSSLAMPMVLLGLIFSTPYLIDLGIIFFLTVIAFQLITLPVEFNASRRAVAILNGNAWLTSDESVGAKAVLRAAAMTYVAAVTTSFLQLLRLLLMSRGRRR